MSSGEKLRRFRCTAAAIANAPIPFPPIEGIELRNPLDGLEVPFLPSVAGTASMSLLLSASVFAATVVRISQARTDF